MSARNQFALLSERRFAPLFWVQFLGAANDNILYWRAGLRKFSPAWFVAIHAPVPLVFGLRFALGL
ncbi:MAG TPA: hypothetical protein VLN25_01745, partial [Burkholderiaceae bacterium]|nr:hypothetical protein [Burkholderiaceae bacterium]